MAYLFIGIELQYDLHIRDVLLVYFFTAIGINARISDLITGGKPLFMLLCLTLGYIVLQDLIDVTVAGLIDQPAAIGILAGSASLIGGHGTSIAWAPVIAENHGIADTLEIGIASATLGLVIASLWACCEIAIKRSKMLRLWFSIQAHTPYVSSTRNN